MHDEVSQALRGPSNSIGAEKETPHRHTTRKTIFEEMRDSNLPPEQKTVDRLKEEGFVLVLAGGDTSAKVLTALTYHLLSNPDILQRLKKELVEAMPDPNVSMSGAKLEQLPYLVSILVRAKNYLEGSDWGKTNTKIKKAVITEGIRIASISTSRLSRSAPTETLRYKDWLIPPGVRISSSSLLKAFFLSLPLSKPFTSTSISQTHIPPLALKLPSPLTNNPSYNPQQTQVGITTHFIHLDPTLFPSPLTFNPSRWLHASDSRRSYEKFVPAAEEEMVPNMR